MRAADEKLIINELGPKLESKQRNFLHQKPVQPWRTIAPTLLHFKLFTKLNVGIVHHFGTVNHLDVVETRHMRTPNTCSLYEVGQVSIC